ncbi:tRNA (N(6)-L-threonylcarbamoyladenosine(37)-C(2))-methylthiotransferase MtaB [Candidatus Peregrinibacteria bacterium RIFOXYC2_FULL_33_13]|nr:MAG: tRNA (N(6)-L-threonylcarbamoyladenosine(37)-C(2))-methylthiotransferase MtaB [Candidatus Peregrinibacteria bacterium RIFOXYC2_FULL_33_13]
MKIGFKTLGCKVNKYESDKIAAILSKKHEIKSKTENLDICIINTCTVTHIADRKSRQAIRQIKQNNPMAKIIVFGCGARKKDNIYIEMPEIDHVFATYDEVINFLSSDKDIDDFENFNGSRTRVLLKIQDGCDNYCSYCIIPFVRGKATSYPERRVISECLAREKQGFKELVITGVNIGEWKNQEKNLSYLLKKILDNTKEMRIRISSIEPVHFDDEFYSLFNNPRLCGHVHLSLQSGSNKILEKMRRRYTTDQYESICNNLRKIRPDIAITTDLIIGYPGEDESFFNESKLFCEKMKFSKIHVFKFSSRIGTIAEKLKDIVSDDEKNKRAKIMRDLSVKLEKEFRKNNAGKEKVVLVDSKIGKKRYIGYTDNYIRVEVFSERDVRGEFVVGRIE